MGDRCNWGGLVSGPLCGRCLCRSARAWAVVTATALAARGKGPKPKGGASPKKATLHPELRRLGIATRRRITELIKAGRISVDGAEERDPEAALAGDAQITVDGHALDRDPPLILKYHKPFGVISSMSDPLGRQDLGDALPGLAGPWEDRSTDGPRGTLRKGGEGGGIDQGVELALDPWISVDLYHPVGRLDKDTTGLLLLSCDGKLTQRLLSPVTDVPRCYRAVVDGDVTAPAPRGDGQHLDALLGQGVRTGEGIFAARTLGLALLPERGEDEGLRSQVTIKVTEGKYRMVRKMLYNCGFPVLELHRTHYGAVHLGDLAAGQLERPSEEEASWTAEIVQSQRSKQLVAARAVAQSA